MSDNDQPVANPAGATTPAESSAYSTSYPTSPAADPAPSFFSPAPAAVPAEAPVAAPVSAEAPAAADIPAQAIPQQPTYEVPAAQPTVGYPAMPGAAPAGPVPPAPAYAPGYAAPAGYPAPVSAPAGYPAPVSAPAGYPTVPGYPAAAAPAQAPKKGRAGIIIVSILAVLFLLGSVAMSGLFLRASSDLDQQKKTTASQTTQISDLNKQLTDTKTQLTTLQESTSGQIADLKKAQTVSKACVDDVDKLINTKTQASFNKAFDTMVKACIVAKAAE